MPSDSRDEEIEAESRRLLGAPFDPDVLVTVMRGEDRLGTWELRDGPHPMPQDPEAVRYELIVRRGRRGGGIYCGIGPRLAPGQIALVGTSLAKGRDYEIGYLKARCAPSVATVRVHYDDGAVSELPTSLSSTTGQRWAVCPLDPISIATRIDFLDQRGAVLETQAVRDPRSTLA